MTEQEKRIGSNMAYVNGVGILVNFAILALLIGPGSTGYDPTYGAITDLISLVASFAVACVVIIAGFSFDHEDFALATSVSFSGDSPPLRTSLMLPAAAVLFSTFIGFDSIAQAGGEAGEGLQVMVLQS